MFRSNDKLELKIQWELRMCWSENNAKASDHEKETCLVFLLKGHLGIFFVCDKNKLGHICCIWSKDIKQEGNLKWPSLFLLDRRHQSKKINEENQTLVHFRVASI